MGLRDHLGRPKSAPGDWGWHGDVMLLLNAEGDRRSVAAGSNVMVKLHAACAAAPASARPALEVTFGPESTPEVHHERWSVEPDALRGLPAGSLVDLTSLEISVPASEAPTPWRLETKLVDPDAPDSAPLAANHWRLWAVPGPVAPDTRPAIVLHESVDAALVSACFPGASPVEGYPAEDGIVVARRFDEELVSFMEAGGRVLMIPDGERGGLALSEHWFLRGAPIVSRSHALLSGPDAKIPAELLLDLQHFDLGGPVVPRLDPWLDELDPLLMLWDNHDLSEVRTHGLVFETGVGEGRLLVTTLDHAAARGAAGPWLLDVFLAHLASGPRPRRSLSPATLERLRQKCDARTVDLTREPWRFRLDPDDIGLSQGWDKPAVNDSGEPWIDLRAGAFSDEQGFRAYDGWAWYRTTVTVPEDWEGRNVFLNIEGADDFYEVYVDGHLLGSAGDLATRTTAFDQPASYPLSDHVAEGAPFTLAIRIHDWQGAGGLFRPLTLSTAPLIEGADLIR